MQGDHVSRGYGLDPICCCQALREPLPLENAPDESLRAKDREDRGDLQSKVMGINRRACLLQDLTRAEKKTQKTNKNNKSRQQNGWHVPSPPFPALNPKPRTLNPKHKPKHDDATARAWILAADLCRMRSRFRPWM